MYGIFTQDQNDKIESVYCENTGFDSNNTEWLYPYPSKGYVIASLSKDYSVVLSRGNPNNYKALLVKSEDGNVITTMFFVKGN